MMATTTRNVTALGAWKALIAIVTLAGCASASVIPLRGRITDWPALAGEWDGSYGGADARHSGTLWFRLVAGEDHAHGDVQMSATGAEPYTQFPPGVWPRAQPVERVHFIPIRFVRVDGDLIEGQLEPYWDPDSADHASTAFRGKLTDGRIDGVFVTRYSDGRQGHGQWRAVRRRSTVRPPNGD
jgi:hypothetical protein